MVGSQRILRMEVGQPEYLLIMENILHVKCSNIPNIVRKVKDEPYQSIHSGSGPSLVLREGKLELQIIPDQRDFPDAGVRRPF